MKVGRRQIKDGSQFGRYYTKPANTEITEIKSGSVNDTCQKIQQLIPRWKHQTERISKVLLLNEKDRKNTAYTLWYYFFTYFQYKEDKKGVEQLRSPRRAFWYRENPGIDCDCFTTSILCMLSNAGITDARAKIIQRPGDSDFSHIYVVLPKQAGTVNWDDPNTYWTIDPVVHEFNKEVSDISKYKTYPMQASALNGLGNIPINTLDGIGNPNQIGTLCGYPAQATVIDAELNRHKSGSSAYVENLKYAILFEQKWKQKGLIGPDANYFSSKGAGLAGIGDWLKKQANNIGDYFDNTKDYSAKINAMHIAAGAPFLPAREGLKLALKFNIFGLATILNYVKNTNPAKFKETSTIWYKYGGDTSNFNAFINEGKGKVPRQVAPAVLNKIPAVKGLIEKAHTIYYGSSSINGLGTGEPVTTTAETSSLISAIPIITELIGAISGILLVIKSSKPEDKPGEGSGSTPDPNNPPPPPSESNTLLKVVGLTAAGIAAKLIFF